MRERGLKQILNYLCLHVLEVAPHAGAWIETPNQSGSHADSLSLPMRERGLKR